MLNNCKMNIRGKKSDEWALQDRKFLTTLLQHHRVHQHTFTFEREESFFFEACARRKCRFNVLVDETRIELLIDTRILWNPTIREKLGSLRSSRPSQTTWITRFRDEGPTNLFSCQTNLCQEFIALLEAFAGSAMVGCVAWVTNFSILNAIKQYKIKTQLVIHDEPWLHTKSREPWKHELLQQYQGLPVLSLQKLNNDTTLQSKLRNAVTSLRIEQGGLMHHKFVVFLDNKQKPCKVWLGSFNLTKRASVSMENATILHDEKSAQEYFDCWLLLFQKSCPFSATIQVTYTPVSFTSENVNSKFKLRSPLPFVFEGYSANGLENTRKGFPKLALTENKDRVRGLQRSL